MDLKGSSTALDTVLFVLLVGASVATLAAANAGDPTGPQRLADETADVLATSTTSVTTRRSGSLTRDSPVSDASGSVTVERRAQGTYAELLTAAAVANPSLEGRPLTGTGGDFERAVANATLRGLPADEANVQVRATWRPYAKGEFASTVVVGRRPPPDADVSVARSTVGSGFPNVSARLGTTATSYDRVARAVARGVVTGLFPPNQTRDALASEGPDRAIVATRYRQTSDVLGVGMPVELADGDVEAANRRLVDELTPRVKRDLIRGFESPSAAARSVAVDRVRIVVRTWSE